MSYCSTSTLARSATVSGVAEVIELMGYKRAKDGLKITNRVGGYIWYDEVDYRSWSGVELDISKTPRGPVRVDTRSTSSRSYFDLVHQNKTLKILRDLFGGHFETDAGRNRYWRPEAPPPPPISSGCFLARWQCHNSFGRVHVYLMTRKLEGPVARDTSSKLLIVDQLNPRLLSNNILVPYMIAVWEEYFRATFAACLRYSSQRELALKRAKLSHTALEKLVAGSAQIERSIAEHFSFQRPSAIHEAFRLLDPGLDLASALKKPYRGRKISLFDTIEELVSHRNALVHTGELRLDLFDAKLKTTIGDLTEGIDRVYGRIAVHYKFTANHDY